MLATMILLLIGTGRLSNCFQNKTRWDLPKDPVYGITANAPR